MKTGSKASPSQAGSNESQAYKPNEPKNKQSQPSQPAPQPPAPLRGRRKAAEIDTRLRGRYRRHGVKESLGKGGPRGTIVDLGSPREILVT